mmetsp:Transcript_4665/g.13053  ORF Transcript_4665/g.13053 Transcript_4665/m.13053 type:complete len:226 (-) Transcript_4665:310-987(-)
MGRGAYQLDNAVLDAGDAADGHNMMLIEEGQASKGGRGVIRLAEQGLLGLKLNLGERFRRELPRFHGVILPLEPRALVLLANDAGEPHGRGGRADDPQHLMPRGHVVADGVGQRLYHGGQADDGLRPSLLALLDNDVAATWVPAVLAVNKSHPDGVSRTCFRQRLPVHLQRPHFPAIRHIRPAQLRELHALPLAYAPLLHASVKHVTGPRDIAQLRDRQAQGSGA